jgi:hypothetical protein
VEDTHAPWSIRLDRGAIAEATFTDWLGQFKARE